VAVIKEVIFFGEVVAEEGGGRAEGLEFVFLWEL